MRKVATCFTAAILLASCGIVRHSGSSPTTTLTPTSDTVYATTTTPEATPGTWAPVEVVPASLPANDPDSSTATSQPTTVPTTIPTTTTTDAPD